MERKTLVVTQRSALWVVVGWPTEAATFMNGATEEDDELLKMRCNPRFCWLARPDSEFCVARFTVGTCTLCGTPLGGAWTVGRFKYFCGLLWLEVQLISAATPHSCFLSFIGWWWRIGYQLSAWWWLHVLTFLRGTQISWNMCLNNQSSVTLLLWARVCHGVGFSLFLILGNYIFIIF
jgi:hypothetical protein